MTSMFRDVPAAVPDKTHVGIGSSVIVDDITFLIVCENSVTIRLLNTTTFRMVSRNIEVQDPHWFTKDECVELAQVLRVPFGDCTFNTHGLKSDDFIIGGI